MSSFGDWLPGTKEAKMRSEAVIKRRTAAAALTTDLDLELQDLQVSLQLARKDHQPNELAELEAALERIQGVMTRIYNDINLIADKPVPERINELQVFEYMDPAVRIESLAVEARKWMEKARQVNQQLQRPREEAGGNIAEAERLRLQAEIELSSARNTVEQLKAAYAENSPEVSAALATAESEVQAATQMIQAARTAQALNAWREANDLARRSATLFQSANGKFQRIRLSELDHVQASQDAEKALNAALEQLTAARTRLQAQAALLSAEPNHYLTPAVQRLGEARRAYKANPPQYVTALRLAKDASSLMEQAIILANQETQKIQQSRHDAHQKLEQLKETVNNLRLALNAHRAVPVRANECYNQARIERDRLLPRESEIEQLSVPQMVELSTEAQRALETAQEGLKLLGG
ncbi:MAG TPA: hypothetical protein VH186_10295 [Chloroflexia bacterium]|nr:hypothetical protein [Chloroflexia bacterium]